MLGGECVCVGAYFYFRSGAVVEALYSVAAEWKSG